MKTREEGGRRSKSQKTELSKKQQWAPGLLLHLLPLLNKMMLPRISHQLHLQDLAELEMTTQIPKIPK